MAEIPDLNDQQVDPPVTGDEMEEFIKSLEGGYAGYGANVNLSTLLPQGQEPEPAPEEESPDEEEGEPDEGPPPDDDDLVINGNRYPRADIERLLNFDQYLRSNPDAAARVTEAVTNKPSVPEAKPEAPPQYTPPELPEGVELDDPISKLLWDQQVATHKELHEVRESQRKQVEAFNQTQQQQYERQAAADMETALSKFSTDFPSLNEDDVAQVRNEGVQYLPAMLQQMNGADALYRSMEIAVYANADLRQKVSSESPNPTKEQKSRTRKQKLGSISGSPTSAPKTESRPQFRSDRDLVEQFAKELAENGLGR